MQCYEYLGAKNQCDLKIIQLPLTRIKMYQYMYIYIYGTHECKGMANEHPRWFTTIIHNYIYHTHLFIYKDMFLLVFSIASIQSNNQLYRSSLPSPHVFPIARSPELIVVIPKTSNTSCSVRETFDILFIDVYWGYELYCCRARTARSGTRSASVMAHFETTTCQGDDGRTYFESWWTMCRLQKQCLLCRTWSRYAMMGYDSPELNCSVTSACLYYVCRGYCRLCAVVAADDDDDDDDHDDHDDADDDDDDDDGIIFIGGRPVRHRIRWSDLSEFAGACFFPPGFVWVERGLLIRFL